MEINIEIQNPKSQIPKLPAQDDFRIYFNRSVTNFVAVAVVVDVAVAVDGNAKGIDDGA